MAHRFRTVHVECKTAEGYRWLKRELRYAAEETPDGFRVTDEGRWSDLLAAAGGREVLQLADKYSGNIVTLWLTGRKVVGAMGCEPKRYMGLTEAEARQLARTGKEER